MRDVSSPTAIVVKAEMPDCLAHFHKDIKIELESAVSIGIEAKLKAWNIARRCFEYGNTNQEVIALVTSLNKANQEKNGGGAPQKPHKYLMDTLVKKGWISKRTSCNWLAQWIEIAGKASLTVTCSEPDFKSTITRDFVLNLENETEEKTDDPEPKDPEVVGDKAGRAAIKPFMDEATGKVRLNPKAYKAWREYIRQVIDAHGDKFLAKQK